MKKLKNSFGITEWSGAVGDLGTMLPLAFALVVYNGFSPERLFFLWGLVYLVTGFYFKVPVSVQPLKAIAVIAISVGIPAAKLSGTAFFFGILLVVLSLTGIIRRLEKWFSKPLVRGIQLTVGLMLIGKSVQLVCNSGLVLTRDTADSPLLPLLINLPVMLLVVLIILPFQKRPRVPILLVLIGIGLCLSLVFSLPGGNHPVKDNPVQLTMPQWDFFFDALVLLILPQIPLTLGNAVFSACDTCRLLHRDRAGKVSATAFGLSIGIGNTLLGLLGGFPICHGAGGIVAHGHFGGKTGGTTMIMGSALILTALISPLSHFLFHIPVPILGGLLFFTGLKMTRFTGDLENPREIAITFVVTIAALVFGNLFTGMLCGVALERLYRPIMKFRKNLT